MNGVTKMARRTNPLTNTEVKQAKPRDKEYNLADGQWSLVAEIMITIEQNDALLIIRDNSLFGH